MTACRALQQRALQCSLRLDSQEESLPIPPDNRSSGLKQMLINKVRKVADAQRGCRLGPCSKDVLDAVAANKGQEKGLLQLPDSLIMAMLEREQLLAKVKLHELNFERVTKEKYVYHLRRLIHLVRSKTQPTTFVATCLANKSSCLSSAPPPPILSSHLFLSLSPLLLTPGHASLSLMYLHPTEPLPSRLQLLLTHSTSLLAASTKLPKKMCQGMLSLCRV